MRRMVLLLLFITVFTLTACEEEIKYVETDNTLNGNSIFYTYHESDVCIALYSTTIRVDSEYVFELLYNCEYSHYVLVGEEYIPVNRYIRENDIPIEELRNSGLGQVIKTTSILSYLDLDIDEYILSRVIVRESEGAMVETPPWDKEVEIDIDQKDMVDYVSSILLSEVEERQVCNKSKLCIRLGGITQAYIEFENNYQTLRFTYYNYHLTIELSTETEEGTDRIIIYDLDGLEGQDELYDKIIESYNKQK